MRKNLIHFEGGCADIVVVDPDGYFYHELTTLPLGPGRYVRIDDRKHYPQLCAGASRCGSTLIYWSDEGLARCCKARLYKTRKGFERAREHIRQTMEVL